MTYKKICALLAAHNLHSAGVPVKEIARQAKKHPSTIRRWLRKLK
jgi:IS30 family transposase